MISFFIEAVAGIVGRADVGAAMFFLMALLSYQKTTSKPNSTNVLWLFFCMLCALCSLYTKEQGVTVLGVCMAYEVLMVSKCNLVHVSSAIQKVCVTVGPRLDFFLNNEVFPNSKNRINM